MLPFELLFHDIKSKDLSVCQIKSVKSKICLPLIVSVTTKNKE